MGNSEKDIVCIEGTLLMLDGATPHVAVPVQAISDGKVVATVLSDEGGRYQFVNLKPGGYQLRCQVLGGYVYYRTTGKLFTSCEDDMGDVLQIKHGEIVKDINLHFAPFKKGTWRNYNYLDGLLNDMVHAIYCDPDGIMWFGTSGGISCYDGKEFTSITTKDGLVHNRVDVIFRDPNGVMWFGGFGGVSCYDGKKFTNFTTENGLAGCNVVRAIYRDLDGMMWFATGFEDLGGVSRYDGKEFVKFSVKDGLAHNNVHAIHQDPDGIMWFGTYGGGVSRYDGKKFVNLTTKDGLANDVVPKAIYCDPDGMMWFATFGKGIYRYDPETFANFSIQDGLVSNQILAMHCDLDGVMWFGTRGGLSRYDGKEFVSFTTADGLPHNTISAIHCDPDGTMWLGIAEGCNNGGISRYDGKTFVDLATEQALDSKYCVYALYCDPDGVIWFGTGQNEREAIWGDGISRYDGNELIKFTTKDGLAGDSVCAIHRDPDGMMWFGTKGGGASRYDGKTFFSITTKDGLPNDYVNVIHRDHAGVMWFGTDGGVSRYNGKEFVNFAKEDGLAHNFVNSIYQDINKVMWFGTEGGVSAYDGIAWTSLDTRDGLAGKSVTSIIQDSEGFLWFGTEGGVTRYRRNITRPKVRIVSVATDQTYLNSCDISAFTPDTRATIEYNSIDFKTLPEKRQYRCRIKEIDPDWRKPTKSDTFDYVFDKPGTYTFEVQAIDRDLNYSEPASVMLQVIDDPKDLQIAELESEIARRNRQLEAELQDAHDMQMSLMPKNPPDIEGFDIAGFSKPAREVGGDFFDYFTTRDRKTGIALADVSGKGLKAAMSAVLTNGMLHTESKIHTSCSEILIALNDSLCPRMMKMMFTALGLAIIEDDTLSIANAAQPYPIIKRQREAFEFRTDTDLPLGMMQDVEYLEQEFVIQTGDIVIFYTDGIIEAENESGEIYGIERLLQFISIMDAGMSSEETIKAIMDDVIAFAGGAEQYDDMTIVVVKRR